MFAMTTRLDELVEGARTELLTELEQERAMNDSLRTELVRLRQSEEQMRYSRDATETRYNKLCQLLNLRDDIKQKATPDGGLPYHLYGALVETDRQISALQRGTIAPVELPQRKSVSRVPACQICDAGQGQVRHPVCNHRTCMTCMGPGCVVCTKQSRPFTPSTAWHKAEACIGCKLFLTTCQRRASGAVLCDGCEVKARAAQRLQPSHFTGAVTHTV